MRTLMCKAEVGAHGTREGAVTDYRHGTQFRLETDGEAVWAVCARCGETLPIDDLVNQPPPIGTPVVVEEL